MKMNNKIAIKLVVIALLLVLISTFTHCVGVGKEVGDGGGSVKQTFETPAGDQDEGQILNELQVTTGVKNFEQILHTMGAVTGIDPYSANAASIMTVYRQVESSLPTDNDIKVFTSTQQVAVTKLAAEFCFLLTQNNFATQRAVVWPDLNLGAQVQNSFNEANTVNFIDDTIQAFWGGVLTQSEYDMAVNEFRELIIDLKGADTTSTAATGRVARGVCTAALSSAYITLL
jgi:hypothetical protein